MSRRITCQFPDGTIQHRWEDGVLEVGSTITTRGRLWAISALDPNVPGRYLVQEHRGEPKPAKRQTRTVPVPWVDCGRCAWRNYPGRVRTQAGWDVSERCSNCGEELTPAMPVA